VAHHLGDVVMLDKMMMGFPIWMQGVFAKNSWGMEAHPTFLA
jgi:hypothetical protein